jgi:hypothetical protein
MTTQVKLITLRMKHLCSAIAKPTIIPLTDENHGELMPETILDHIKEERKFIHDVSSPLMVAIGMLDVSVGVLTNKQDIDGALVKLEKSKKALEKMTAILKERRSSLIKFMEEIEGSTD